MRDLDYFLLPPSPFFRAFHRKLMDVSRILSNSGGPTCNDRSFTLYTAASERPRNNGKEGSFLGKSRYNICSTVSSARIRTAAFTVFCASSRLWFVATIRSVERRHFVDNSLNWLKNVFIIEYRHVHEKRRSIAPKRRVEWKLHVSLIHYAIIILVSLICH